MYVQSISIRPLKISLSEKVWDASGNPRPGRGGRGQPGAMNKSPGVTRSSDWLATRLGSRGLLIG
jgi:hypothetical protein